MNHMGVKRCVTQSRTFTNTPRPAPQLAFLSPADK